MTAPRASDAFLLGKLSAALDDAAQLLTDVPARPETSATSPAQLLAQCLGLCAQTATSPPEPIRLIHHLACTGGTLIAKCIAAMPNIQLLSEVDPLSTIQDRDDEQRFAPNNIIALMRFSSRGASQETLLDLFLNDIDLIYRQASRYGQRLVLRDHAHSQFCLGAEVHDRPTLRAIVSSRFPCRSVVTVRHPLDSYISLVMANFVDFTPPTFFEYCLRCIAFLQHYEHVPYVRYEDFVRVPAEAMRLICGYLDIPYSEQFITLYNTFRLSGDSGRSGERIEPRPRRPVDENFLAAIRPLEAYRLLCRHLNYDE
jgi:hypothetical protein